MSQDLGTAVERDGTLVWSSSGRALSAYERRMRDHCGRLWLPLFDGVYHLGIVPVAVEASWEARHGRSLISMHGFDIDHREMDRRRSASGLPITSTPWRRPLPPTHEQALDLIRASVAAGAKAVINGTLCPVSAKEAAALVDYHLGSAPMAALEPIVSAILNLTVNGLAPTAEEKAAFTIGSADPVAPGWALNA